MLAAMIIGHLITIAIAMLFLYSMGADPATGYRHSRAALKIAMSVAMGILISVWLARGAEEPVKFAMTMAIWRLVFDAAVALIALAVIYHVPDETIVLTFGGAALMIMLGAIFIHWRFPVQWQQWADTILLLVNE